MRPLFVALVLPLSLLATTAATCGVGNSGTPCAVSADCDDGALCVGGFCADDPSQGPGGEGEGEGEPGEGEGEIIGEGEGEGEGEVIVGGEGEGEGEGEPGEGEGEGEPTDDCSPACNDLQECFDGTCEYVGEICDAFDPGSTIGIFDEVAGSLSDDDAVRYEVLDTDGEPSERFVRNFRIVGVPAALTLEGAQVATEVFVQISGIDMDPALLAIRDDDGQCEELFRDDIAGGPAQVNILFGAPVELEIGVTSATEELDAGGFTIRTRPILCGRETANLQAFDQCRRAFHMTPTFTCEASNPCARDAAEQLTGQACCVSNVDCGGGPGTPIRLVNNQLCTPPPPPAP